MDTDAFVKYFTDFLVFLGAGAWIGLLAFFSICAVKTVNAMLRRPMRYRMIMRGEYLSLVNRRTWGEK